MECATEITIVKSSKHLYSGEVTEEFGDRLRRLREERGLSRERLVLALGGAIGAQQIYNLETGKSAWPERETLRLLAGFYGVTEPYLLFGVEPAPPAQGNDWPPLSAILRVTTEIRPEDVPIVERIIRQFEEEQRRTTADDLTDRE